MWIQLNLSSRKDYRCTLMNTPLIPLPLPTLGNIFSLDLISFISVRRQRIVGAAPGGRTPTWNTVLSNIIQQDKIILPHFSHCLSLLRFLYDSTYCLFHPIHLPLPLSRLSVRASLNAFPIVLISLPCLLSVLACLHFLIMKRDAQYIAVMDDLLWNGILTLKSGSNVNYSQKSGPGNQFMW